MRCSLRPGHGFTYPALPVAVLVLALPSPGCSPGPGALHPAEHQEPSARIVLTLTDVGEPSINGQVVGWDDLNAQIKAIYGRRQEKTLFVSAHPSNSYHVVVRIVDLAKRHGVAVEFLPYSAGQAAGLPNPI